MSRVCVRVRPAEHGDVPGIVAVISTVDTAAGLFSGRALFDGAADHLEQRLHEILDEGVRTLVVAVDEQSGEVTGLLVVRSDEIGAIDLTPALHVTHLLVAPKQRRRGIGRALLAAAAHLAEERGCDRVLASAAAGSREGNRYLARLGFAPLVVHRVAPVAALRRSLGLTDAAERVAVLRRARLGRGGRTVRTARAVGRGA